MVAVSETMLSAARPQRAVCVCTDHGRTLSCQVAAEAAQAHESADGLQQQVQRLQDKLQAAEQVAPEESHLGNDAEFAALQSRVAELAASLAEARQQQEQQQQQQQPQHAAPDAAKAAQRAAAAEATAAALRSEVDMMREALQTAAVQVRAELPAGLLAQMREVLPAHQCLAPMRTFTA